jgi:hypothetical protein
MRIVILILFVFNLAFASSAQIQSKTYSETRKLLFQMDRTRANKQFKRLFEEAHVRMPDLIQALDDSEQKVNPNSQVIINYLAEPEGLKALDKWKKRQTRTFAVPNVKFLTEKIYLEGNGSYLIGLVQKNKQLFQGIGSDMEDVSFKLIGYNKKTETAVFEIVQGQVFTEGWHSVIKFEDRRWRLILDNNIWVH